MVGYFERQVPTEGEAVRKSKAGPIQASGDRSWKFGKPPGIYTEDQMKWQAAGEKTLFFR